MTKPMKKANGYYRSSSSGVVREAELKKEDGATANEDTDAGF